LASAKEEASRAAAKAVKVKKMAEEKLSSSAAKLAALQIAKEKVEAELDQNYDESEELLKQCFDRAVRQAHVLYGGPPTAGEFNMDYEVHQGRLVPSAEVGALVAQEAQVAGTQEGEAEAEEGECVEIQD